MTVTNWDERSRESRHPLRQPFDESGGALRSLPQRDQEMLRQLAELNAPIEAHNAEVFARGRSESPTADPAAAWL